MKQITTLKVRDRQFIIIKHESNMYCAIEDKYITNGKLNTRLNGLQMHANKILEDCLEITICAVECDYLISQGYTQEQAIKEVFNIK